MGSMGEILHGTNDTLTNGGEITHMDATNTRHICAIYNVLYEE